MIAVNLKQMYKVFLNDRMIVITASGNITINKPVVKFDKTTAISEIKEWFDSFVRDATPKIYLVHPEPVHFFQQFKMAFRQLPAAGGVVRQNERLLFIFRRNKWDLPKGKIDDGENARQAALREVEEECGAHDLKIGEELSPSYHTYEQNGVRILKTTYWFEMISAQEKFTPETEEDIEKVEWVDLSRKEIEDLDTYPNIRLILRSAIDLL